MKQRYKLLIEFKGTHYSGWQIQPNAITVEEKIEQALTKILQCPVDIKGQGRTDSGVHAEKQVAHVDLHTDKTTTDILYALRGVLPHDIYVWKMEKTEDDFHARFDAKSRCYRYQILTRPSPLLKDTAVFKAFSLDLKQMERCAEIIEGTHDFINFSKASSEQKSTVCHITTSTLEQKGDLLIIYRIAANRFVHHMVRRLVGTMLKVGMGKTDFTEFKELLFDTNTSHICTGITGKGLILEDVEY